MESVTYATMFKALADPTRVAVMRMLTVEKRCACQILERFAITQPTLSHHMAILVAAGLVLAERRGKWVFYGVNGQAVDAARGFFDTIGECGSDCARCGEE